MKGVNMLVVMDEFDWTFGLKKLKGKQMLKVFFAILGVIAGHSVYTWWVYPFLPARMTLTIWILCMALGAIMGLLVFERAEFAPKVPDSRYFG